MRGPATVLPVPEGGTYTAVPPALIPPGYLWRSLNVVGRYGEIVNRPGYEKVVPTGPGGRISGGLYFKLATGATRIVAGTLTGWYQVASTTWTNISGAALTGDADNPVRFAVFPSSGAVYLIGVNNMDAPQVWDGLAATYSALGGSPPSTARDITVAANRVILGNVIEAGNRAITRIRCSDFNNHAAWTASVTADLPDSWGEIVAVRALGRTAFMVYTDDVAWIATAQSGVFPFRFDRLEDRPGPVSPAAVVTVGRAHYYLGYDARIYRCNGLAVEVVSRAVEKDLRGQGIATDAFRLINKKRAWGLYKKEDESVWFFYPGPSSSEPDRAISYHVPTGACYFHAFPVSMSSGWSGDEVATLRWDDLAGYTWDNIAATYPTWDSFGGTLVAADFVGSATGQVYRLRYDVDDDGTALALSWEYPPQALAGPGMRMRVDAIESAFMQVSSGPAVTVQASLSEAAAEETDPTYVTPAKRYLADVEDAVTTHDTSSAARQVLAFADPNANMGNFLGVKYNVTTSRKVRFRGAEIRYWAEALA